MPCAPIAINPTDRANANKASSIKPASVMGRASVKGFGQVKNPGEDLIFHRVLRHKFRSLLFLFHCIRTSGLRDTPYPGFALPSVVSRMAATLCLVQIWSLGTYLLRVFSVSR